MLEELVRCQCSDPSNFISMINVRVEANMFPHLSALV